MRARPVVVGAMFACWLFAGAVLFSGAAAAATVQVDHTLSQTDAKGEVNVVTQVSVPSGTTSLEITLPEGSTVSETRGFSKESERTYSWTRTTDEPYLEYAMQGNVTVDRGSGERHLYAVTDDWAIVRTPNVKLQWTGIQADVDVSSQVDGEGVGGRHITYLGPYTETTREAEDQRFRFVEAGASDLKPDRDSVLDTLEMASNRLQIGTKDDEVLVIVVPTANIEWAATGVQRGDADIWVRDVEGLSNPKNSWIHEYVHTRQNYDRTDATRWTIEGMADYYAALLTYEAGYIDYEQFRNRMADGRESDVSTVRLVDPSTWESNRGNYNKGPLVFGHLDRKLRADHDTTIDRAIAEFNAEGTELTQETFLDAVETAGGSDIRSEAKRYTETTDVPGVWSRQEHVEAFGGPDVGYEFDAFAVSGPYRDGAVETPRIVSGETLSTTVTVRNDGSRKGDYDVAVRVDGEVVDRRTGTLGPGEETSLTVEHTFETPGEYELSVGTASTTVVVQEPADVEVTDLALEPETVAPGERVTLRATVRSTADRPAAGEVVFTLEGATVTTETVRTAGGTSTVETTTTVDTSGQYEVTAGGRSATLVVTDGSGQSGWTGPGTDRGGTPTAGDGPGLGAASALVALVAAALFRRGRR